VVFLVVMFFLQKLLQKFFQTCSYDVADGFEFWIVLPYGVFNAFLKVFVYFYCYAYSVHF